MEETIFDDLYDEESNPPANGGGSEDQDPPNEGSDPNGDPNNPNPEEGGDDSELDENGNPEGTEYDEDGNPTNLDEDGNLITEDGDGEDEKDEQGNPKGTEYDEEGNPTNLDEDGNLIKEDDGDQPSVITQFFEKQFDIKEGKIPFEDGSEMSLDEMTPEQQLEALEFYTKHTLEQATGQVTKEERAVLDEIRKNGKSFNDVVTEEVNNRLLKKQVDSELGEPVDYEQMSDEEVYKQFIKENKPDFTEEQIAEIVEKGKEHPAFDATVAHYRQHLTKVQEQERTQKEAEKKAEAEKELNEDKTTIIDAAKNLDDVAGWPLNDDIKNDILGELVEVDAEGNSNFMKEVFGDPNKMFEAAWYMKYGEAYFQELNNHWKSEVDRLEKELEAAKTGTKTTKKKGMAKPGTKPAAGQSANKTGARKTNPKKKSEPKSLDDIYEDN